MSLAQAIFEYLIEKVGATSLFATHYHELTQMDYRYPQVKNAHMSIRETGDKMRDLVFLYTLKEGPANKSYGIHVAQLAGLPKKVIRRAEVLLENLESFQSTSSDQLSLLQIPVEDLELKGPESKDSIEVQDHPLVSQIESVTLQSLTPLDALNLIADWQKQLL